MHVIDFWVSRYFKVYGMHLFTICLLTINRADMDKEKLIALPNMLKSNLDFS